MDFMVEGCIVIDVFISYLVDLVDKVLSGEYVIIVLLLEDKNVVLVEKLL